MRIIATCLLLLIPASWMSARDDEEWKSFSHKKGKFNVKMPGKPKSQPAQDISYPGGKSKIYLFILEVDDGKGAYGVAYNDFPEGKGLDDKAISTVLDLGRDGAVKGYKGKLKSSKNIKLEKKFPGRDFVFDVVGDLGGIKAGRERMFFVDGRLYQLIVLGSEEMVKSKQTTQFLDSFSIAEVIDD